MLWSTVYIPMREQQVQYIPTSEQYSTYLSMYTTYSPLSLFSSFFLFFFFFFFLSIFHFSFFICFRFITRPVTFLYLYFLIPPPFLPHIGILTRNYRGSAAALGNRYQSTSSPCFESTLRFRVTEALNPK